VDDMDLVQSGIPDQDMEVLAHRMQAGMDTWEGDLQATGGALEPEKSFWYVISFRWISGTWRYSTVAETPASVSAQNADGNRVTLQRLEARKPLGVTAAPDGNKVAEFERLLRESQKRAKAKSMRAI
jgi:hypothetical protein